MKCTFSLSDQQNISNLRRGTLDAVSACTVPAQTLRESPTQGLSTVKKPECSRAASTSVLASDKANPHTQPSIYQAWLENGRHFRQSTHAATSPVGELLKEQQRRMHKHRERERENGTSSSCCLCSISIHILASVPTEGARHGCALGKHST